MTNWIKMGPLCLMKDKLVIFVLQNFPTVLTKVNLNLALFPVPKSPDLLICHVISSATSVMPSTMRPSAKATQMGLPDLRFSTSSTVG